MRVETGSEQDTAVAAEAFVFGYPLVLMKLTHDRFTAVPAPAGTHAPVNQFGHQRTFPDPTADRVTNPNVDTLYSSAWLDLSAEPVVLSVPDTAGRYYLMPMLDAWTNVFAAPGARTAGTGAGRFGIVGPNWRGSLPDGMRTLRSPTNMAWVIARVQAGYGSDQAEAHHVQDGLRLAPLSECGRGERPSAADGQHAGSAGRVAPSFAADPTASSAVGPATASGTDAGTSTGVDPTLDPVDRLSAMDAAEFFGLLGSLLVDNPPRAADQPVVDRMAKLGIGAGEQLNWAGLDEPTRAALTLGARRGMATVTAEGRTPRGEYHDGWVLSYDLGEYGTYYARRAGVAWVGLGANHAEDAVYAQSRATDDKRPYTGEHRYVLHLDPGTVPPVRAFWSLTLYDEHQFFVPNPINRYAISSRDELTSNPDGSIDIMIQHDMVDGATGFNWLPAPPGPFTLVLRMYWPERTVLTRAWRPPPVRQVD